MKTIDLDVEFKAAMKNVQLFLRLKERILRQMIILPGMDPINIIQCLCKLENLDVDTYVMIDQCHTEEVSYRIELQNKQFKPKN